MTAPEDFVEWATAHRTRLLRSAFLLTGDVAAAEDLVQEAVIKVAQRWDRLRTGHPTAYARTIIARDHASGSCGAGRSVLANESVSVAEVR